MSFIALLFSRLVETLCKSLGNRQNLTCFGSPTCEVGLVGVVSVVVVPCAVKIALLLVVYYLLSKIHFTLFKGRYMLTWGRGRFVFLCRCICLIKEFKERCIIGSPSLSLGANFDKLQSASRQLPSTFRLASTYTLPCEHK